MKLPIKNKLSQAESKRLEILKRKKKTYEDSKRCLLNQLQPILDELEKIRLEIDKIEIS